MQKEKKMRKNDWLLLVVVLGIVALMWVLRAVRSDAQPGQVTVRVDGEVVETFELTENREIEVNGGTNVFQIKDGKVKMVKAKCPDQLCVHQKAISKNNESIICLPNEVVLQIVSGEESSLDAVASVK